MKENKRKELGKALQKLTKSTGQSEGVFADGGATVSQDIHPDILSPNFAAGSLYSQCTIINVGDNKTGLKIPVSNVTTISKTSVRGGFRAYKVGEGATKTASTGSFGILNLSLQKEAVVVPCTDELLQDSEALASYINKSAEEALITLADDSIIHSNGLMEGIAGAAATGHVAMTDPMTIAELHNFFDKYYGGPLGKWYVSKVIFGQILDLFETAAAGSILLTSSEGKYYLFGYEVVVSPTLLVNEMVLADLSQFVIIQKEIQSDVNESLKFLEDEKYFRFVLRISGASLWKSPITLADGSVVHPFVMTTDMEESSSSESSYVENWSSSSSSKSNSSDSSGSSQSDSSQSDSSDSGSDSSESSSESSEQDSSSSDSTNSSDSSGG